MGTFAGLEARFKVPVNSDPEASTTTRATVTVAAQDSSDDEIVARVLAGDRLSFEVLMRRHNQLLYRAARAILRSDDEAEDVMQHAYLRAFEHLADYQGRARFSTWLTRIAVHEAFARLRRQKRVGQLDDVIEE